MTNAVLQILLGRAGEEAPRLCVVDVETTGFSARYDRITEVAYAEFRLTSEGEAIERRQGATLINPGKAIPAEVTKITGITDEMVAGADTWVRSQVVEDLRQILKGAVLIGHNVGFDRRFLWAAWERAGIMAPEIAGEVDTKALAKAQWPGQSNKLTDICKRQGIEHEDAHRAVGDVIATDRLLRMIVKANLKSGQTSLIAAPQNRKMSYEEYAARAGWRWSTLRILRAGSPLKARYSLDHPQSGDTSSRSLLRAIHCAILEPEVFAVDYVIYRASKTRQGKLWQAHLAAHPDKETLLPKELLKIEAMVRAAREHPLVSYILASAYTEISREWASPVSGLLCQARYDIVLPGEVIDIWDLKTVGDASERSIRGMIKRLGWAGQGAHYREGARVRNPAKAVRYGLICIEDKAPHDIGIWRLTDVDLDEADEERQELLQIIKQCTEDDSWPGRHEDEPGEMDLNPWRESSMTVVTVED